MQSNSLTGSRERAEINSTVFDFYFVPKLADPSNFITIDPALSFDWESEREFSSLAVTMGRAVGTAFGGNGRVFVKPSVFAGGERSATRSSAFEAHESPAGHRWLCRIHVQPGRRAAGPRIPRRRDRRGKLRG